MRAVFKFVARVAAVYFMASSVSAEVVFHDTFLYTADSAFLAEGGWTFWNSEGGCGAGSGVMHGQTTVLEYNHTNSVATGDWLTVDANLIRDFSGYFYGMQIALWDGVDTGTRTNRASVVLDGAADSTDRALQQLLYEVTAADLAAGLDHVIFQYSHAGNWGETADVTLQVVGPGEPPYWTVNPIQGDDGMVTNDYSGTLSGLAADPNLEEITYSLVTPSDWLIIADDGTLSGTPGPDDDGTNTFTVAAASVDGTANAVLNIFIAKAPRQPDIVLINNTTANGSFEEPSDGKIMFISGTIPFWSNWAEQDTADGDTGTDGASGGTQNGLDGARVAFLQPGGAIVNMVTNAPHTIQEGDIIVYGFWNSLVGRAPATISLVYDDGGALTQIPGTEITATAGTRGIGEFTVQAGDAWIGMNLGTGIVSGGSWPEVDQVFLGVALKPAGPVSDLTIAGPISGGTSMVLSWTGEDGGTYGVETNSNLILGNWQTFRSGISGNGGILSVTNNIGPDQTFYRVLTE